MFGAGQIALAYHQCHVRATADGMRQSLAIRPPEFVDPRCVDQHDLTVPQGLPDGTRFLPGFAMQRARGKALAPQQRIQQ